jgi:hypothetical protein
MSDQNFKNHSRYITLYHFITTTLIGVLIVSSVMGLFHALSDHTNHGSLHNGLLFFVTSIVLLLLWWYCRAFALRAQDRAIRAEENFRHFLATGKPLDSRLRMSQIIALRFAGDDEFVGLAKRAADENLQAKDIKAAIKNWKADHNRV